MNGTYGQAHDGDHHQHSNGGANGSHNLPQQMINPNQQQRTLYVGNLNTRTTEEQLLTCFQPFGKIVSLKLINEVVSDPYCFIEYDKHEEAALALSVMNQRKWIDKEIKVNWASSLSSTQQGGIGASKNDLAKHSHIFVGDLSPEIDTPLLFAAFSPLGDISDCRVVRDPHSNKSRCYGFVSFVNRQDAENAITKMNGQLLGARSIRTNWASRKPVATRTESAGHIPQQNGRTMTFEEVYQQSGTTNCTVYCGGIFNGLSDDLMNRLFRPFGTIQDVRVFKDKGYAFVRFASKDAATNAIMALNNQDINGQTMKCSWGKGDQETNTASSAVAMLNPHPAHAHLAQNMNAAAAAAATNYLYTPYGQMGAPFFYPHAAMSMAQGLPSMQYGMSFGGQFYPSSSPGAPPNGFMMGAQIAAMQQQPPPTTPNGVAQQSSHGSNHSHPPQAPVTPQTHHHHHPQHHQPPPTANVQTHHQQQQQPNGNHFGAYPPPQPVMAYQQMQ